MNMIKSFVVALMVSGTVAVLPNVAVAQTQEAALQNVPKSDLVAVQKAYNKTTTTKDGAASFDRFADLMRKAIAYQKNQLVQSNEAPAQSEKYEKMVSAFNKVIMGNRQENKTEVNAGMTAFINAL